jgi:hypothetical protein
MEIHCLVLVKKKREDGLTDYLESSISMTINGKMKDCLRIVGLLKRRYGKENVL